eukprot:15075696-Alexandrium_andersonii.AAC.1
MENELGGIRHRAAKTPPSARPVQVLRATWPGGQLNHRQAARSTAKARQPECNRPWRAARKPGGAGQPGRRRICGRRRH